MGWGVSGSGVCQELGCERPGELWEPVEGGGNWVWVGGVHSCLQSAGAYSPPAQMSTSLVNTNEALPSAGDW